MNWHDAVKACTDLGNGWKLPTKYELNLMYLNKDKIGDFTYRFYWSSTENGNYSYDGAWGQYLNTGIEGYMKKDQYTVVRAVRTF